MPKHAGTSSSVYGFCFSSIAGAKNICWSQGLVMKIEWQILKATSNEKTPRENCKLSPNRLGPMETILLYNLQCNETLTGFLCANALDFLAPVFINHPLICYILPATLRFPPTHLFSIRNSTIIYIPFPRLAYPMGGILPIY